MKTLFAAVAFVASTLFLVGCVEPPKAEELLPKFSLTINSDTTYPGSRFQVSVIENEGSSPLTTDSFSWSSSLEGIQLVSSTKESAEFSVDLSVQPNQEFTITSTAKNNSGSQTSKSVLLRVVAEPSIIIDAENASATNADAHPIYLTGAYSAKAINLKSTDQQDSSNYAIDVSPNGRYAFYIQQLAGNGDWVARLYDLEDNLNYSVQMNFVNIDQSNIQTFWSPSSEYLALRMPTSSSDRLVWFSTIGLTETDETTPIVSKLATLNFSKFIWSDNTGTEEHPYAVVISTDGSDSVTGVRIFDPTQLSPLSTVAQDENSSILSLFKADSMEWAKNQLFFIANNTSGAGLFRWNSTTRKIQKINSESSTVSQYAMYDATHILFSGSDSLSTEGMYFYNGISDSLVSDLTMSEPGNEMPNSYVWSPNGQVVALQYPKSVVTWAEGSAPVVWVTSTDDLSDTLEWDESDQSLTLLRVTGDEKDLYTVNTEKPVEEAFVRVVRKIENSDITGTNIPAAIQSSLVRSPTGLWQLFWGLDSSSGSDHVDLWAYNTLTQEAQNVSRLGQDYQAPSSPGFFSTQSGYANTDPKWVDENIIWVSDNEIAFSVMDTGTTGEAPVIDDVRMVSLDTMSTPKSLNVDPDSQIVLKQVIGN